MRFQPANPPSSPNPPAKPKPSPSAREGLSSGTRELSAHRQAAVRWGFNVADVQDAIQTAVGGNAVSQVLQGEARYDRMLRYQKPYRDTRKAIENVRLLSPSGERVSLAQLTKVDNNDGAEEIYREGQQWYIVVKYSVRGRDLGPVFQYRNQFLNHHHMAGLCGRKHHELFQPDGGSLHAKFLAGAGSGHCLYMRPCAGIPRNSRKFLGLI